MVFEVKGARDALKPLVRFIRFVGYVISNQYK